MKAKYCNSEMRLDFLVLSILCFPQLNKYILNRGLGACDIRKLPMLVVNS